jgi:hypothetical protein
MELNISRHNRRLLENTALAELKLMQLARALSNRSVRCGVKSHIRPYTVDNSALSRRAVYSMSLLCQWNS